MAPRHEQFLNTVPRDLRAKLIEDAEEQESNVTDVAVAILAERYKVAVPESRGRRTTPNPDSQSMLLRVPERLHTAIAHAAVTNKTSAAKQIIADLCSYYTLPVPDPPRRRRRRSSSSSSASAATTA